MDQNPILAYREEKKMTWKEMAKQFGMPYGTIRWLARIPPVECGSVTIDVAKQLYEKSRGKIDLYRMVGNEK